MKKIYLEKQFMKATNNNGYIIGEIVGTGGNTYTIKKQDGSILTVFPHAILGWEDYKENEETGYKFHYYAKELEELKSPVFYCDLYKNGEFIHKYSHDIKWNYVFDSSENFRHFLIKQGEVAERIIDESWNRLRDKEKQSKERHNIQKAFTTSQLEKLTYINNEKLEGKTIYALDTCRCLGGLNITGLTVAKLTDEGIVVVFNDILHGKHRIVADLVINMAKNQEGDVEIHLDATGLGVGLLDYLKEAPCRVVKHEISALNQAHLKLIEKVEKEEIKFMCNQFETRGVDLLSDLEIITYSNGKVRLQPYKKDEKKKALLGSLLVAMCSDDK